MSNNSKEEPKTAPNPDCWYDLALGPSFKDDSSNKFCTLRYEFKPASIDKSRSGTLHKNKDNRVAVEFQNNQTGKPKVTFEGSSEDYKENDAVLFFDGKTFRLERLHRAVKQLRHLRMAGESVAASQGAVSMEPRLSPVGRGAKPSPVDRSLPPAVPVEVERIEIGKPENSAGPKSNPENVSAVSPGDDGGEHHEIDLVDIFGSLSPESEKAGEENADGGFVMNVEEEIADVDDESGDEGERGLNAAEALRAQVNAEGLNAAEALRAQVDAEELNKQSSSSSTSSGSRSSSGSESDDQSRSRRRSRSRSRSSGSESSSSSSSQSSSSGESGSSNGGGGGGGGEDDDVNSI